MSRILTMCRAGLSRSLALADVLKFHFPPADAIPCGVSNNSAATLLLLVHWADHVVLMREKFRDELAHKIGPLPQEKILVCEVGPDIHGYANPAGRKILIPQVWGWARVNSAVLGVTEGKNFAWHEDKLT